MMNFWAWYICNKCKCYHYNFEVDYRKHKEFAIYNIKDLNYTNRV